MLDEHIRQQSLGLMPYLDLFGIRIPSYSFFMILAITAGYLAYRLTRTRLDEENSKYRSIIILTAFLGGIIGAKLPILVLNYQYLFSYPQNISLLLSGKTIVGGLIGGFLSVIILKKSLGIKARMGNDIAAPVALAMAIGRLGCLFGGCCYGISAPAYLGIDFGDGPRYPTQIYELAFDLLLFVILLYIKRYRNPRPGMLFHYLLNSYLTFRFFIEFIRETDHAFWILSWYQIICIVCLFTINGKRLIERRKEEKNG